MESFSSKFGLKNCDDYVLFTSPSILKRKYVAHLLKECEMIFEKNPVVMQQNVIVHKSLIFDLTALQSTDFSLDQMNMLITLMKRFRFECFIVVPPPSTLTTDQTISPLNRVNTLLARTIPIFHHNEIFVFFAKTLTDAHTYVHKLTDLNFQYTIEFDAQYVILHIPQTFIQPVIAQFLVELDDVFPNLSPDDHGIIIDYSKLQESDMSAEQMAKAIQIVVNYGFRTLVYILPVQTPALQVLVMKWLNKSVQVLNNYGVRVDFGDSVEDAKKIIDQYHKLPEIVNML